MESVDVAIPEAPVPASNPSSASPDRLHRVHRLRGPARALRLALASLLAAELVLRVLFPARLALGGASPLVYAPDQEFGYHYIPNATSTICAPTCRTVGINAGGLIGPHFQKEKQAGVYRIAVIGQSDATGMWMDGGQPYPVQLEKMLIEAGVNAEVFNFSVDGDHRQSLDARIAREIVPQYSPDLVLMSVRFPFVDAAIARTNYRGYVLTYAVDIPGALEDAKRRIDFIEEHRLAITIYETSYLARAMTRMYMNGADDWRVPYLKAFIQKRYHGPYRLRPSSTKKTLDILADVKRTLETKGTKLLLMRFEGQAPVPLEARDRALEFLSLRLPERDVMDEKYNGHFNHEAHRNITQQLFERLPWGQGGLAVRE